MGSYQKEAGHYLEGALISQIWDNVNTNKDSDYWGTWVAQGAKRPTLGFISGHGLGVVGLSPASGSVLSGESV